MNFKILDYIIIIFITVFVSVLTVLSYKESSTAGEVHIKTPAKQYIYKLDQDNIIDVQGLKGKTRIKIKDGKVRITESACPLKICIKNGAISHTGEYLVCLPNGIIVSIKGKDEENNTVDAFSD